MGPWLVDEGRSVLNKLLINFQQDAVKLIQGAPGALHLDNFVRDFHNLFNYYETHCLDYT